MKVTKINNKQLEVIFSGVKSIEVGTIVSKVRPEDKSRYAERVIIIHTAKGTEHTIRCLGDRQADLRNNKQSN